jgi:hypothetical protein
MIDVHAQDTIEIDVEFAQPDNAVLIPLGRHVDLVRIGFASIDCV